MSLPLISVIIPTRNRRDMLAQTVASALAQTYENFEVIVHDNNSHDGSAAYIKEHFSDPRLTVRAVDHDLAMQQNWNQAWSYVRGEYFVRLDDDNVWQPTFLAEAYAAIQEHKLQVFSASPLIIHLYHKLFLLFEPNAEVAVLNPWQSAYLEYYALTDSNYTLYETALVKRLFAHEDVYQSTLPDRFMNYRIAAHMVQEGLRVGVSAAVTGATRYDYRLPPYSDPNGLRWVDYSHMTPEKVGQAMDCQTNFTMHRVATLWRWRESLLEDSELRRFLDKAILDPALYRIDMMLGHIDTARAAYTWTELGIFQRYAWLILVAVWQQRHMMIESRCGSRAWLYIAADLGARYGLSWYYILIGRRRDDVPLHAPEGDALAQRVMAGESLPLQKAQVKQGRLADVLRRVTQMKQEIG